MNAVEHVVEVKTEHGTILRMSVWTLAVQSMTFGLAPFQAKYIGPFDVFCDGVLQPPPPKYED